MKILITLEVDPCVLFDAVASVGDGGSAIGTRLVGVLLAPNQVGFGTSVAMDCYGVTVKNIENLKEEG